MKYVYLFGDGKAEGDATMKNLLGGKGANLAEMNLIGIPVPPGFTVTTEACTIYNEQGRDTVVKLIEDEVHKAVKNLEKIMGTKFGDSKIRCYSLFVRGGKGIHAWYDGHCA